MSIEKAPSPFWQCCCLILLIGLLPTCRKEVSLSQLLKLEVSEGNYKLLANDHGCRIYHIPKGESEAMDLARRLALKRYDHEGPTILGITVIPPFYQSEAGQMPRLIGIGKEISGKWILYIIRF
jgi:hypothetical protein